ncbi:hypothetical protein ACFC0M_05920 [Streptomyces sp. NPDC056149]|uniref:hypothetical protein n=1 Tax=Streptomyces sp. NPDC056149 TaxID=3345728 RepID=UPI0035DB72F3
MTTPRLDPATAWDLYVALDYLAVSHTLGEDPSQPGGLVSDLAYARDRVACHRAALEAADPQLLERVESVLAEWADRPAERLVRLLPLRDELSHRSGGGLPDMLPPAS